MLFLVGSEARRRQGRFLSDGVLMILAIVMSIMVTVGVIGFTTDLFSGSDSARVGPSQTEQMDTAPAMVQSLPFNPAQDEPTQAQTEPEITPIAPEWVSITPDWEYTTVIPPMPVGEGIYNGRASGATWGTPGSRDTPNNEQRRKIAQHIVPSITENDAVGLSIVRNPDNPHVVLAAVHIIRDIATTDGMQQESYLGLSLDNQESWIILESPDFIDHVIVTGIVPLHLEIRPFSSPGYFKTDVSP